MAPGTALHDAREAMRVADVDPGQASPVAAKAVRRARQEHDAAAAAIAERAWGHAQLQCGEMGSAIRHLRRAISFGQQAGSRVLAGEARMELAYALIQRGRPQAALQEVEAALLDLDGASGARARAQRAVILYQIGRLDEALIDFQLALPVLREADDLLGVQRMLVNRSIVLGERYAFARAEADLREAGQLAQQLGRKPAVGIVAANLAHIETLRGDVPAALGDFSRAEQICSEYGLQLGPIFQDRAELLLSVGLVSEAREAADRAVLVYLQEHRELKVPEVRLLLAQVAFVDGDWPTALEHARQALREFTRQRRDEWAALARLVELRARLALGDHKRINSRQVDAMVDTLARNGWPAAAVEARLAAARLATLRSRRQRAHGYLQQASRVRHRRGPATLRARGWYAEALLRLGRDDQPGAAAAARGGLRILDEHGAALGATDLRVHSAAHRTELTELGLRTALLDGRPARVFEWAERGRASRLLHRPVRPPADPKLAELLSQLRATAVDVDRSHRTGRSAAKAVQRQVELEQQIRDHCRLVRGAVPSGASGLAGPSSSASMPADPVSPSIIAAELGDRALVEFVQLDGVLYGLSLVAGRLRLRSLGAVADVAGLVERLPFALHRMARGDDRAQSQWAAVTLLRQAAARLGTLLLEPMPELEDRPLVVVPTGVLHSVPWSILPACAGRPVAVSPSATLWHATSTRPQEPASRVAVAAGPRLAGAKEEAIAVAEIHQVDALTGDAATVDAVLDVLASANIVHLAAHGRLSPDNPLFSHLQLHDGPLVVYDLEQLPAVPHTVVLAACDSGRAAVRTGDELLGLSAAFVARGAAQLIASVVPIPDAETAPLMVAFHRRLIGREPPAVALAAAQQELRDEGPATLAAAAGFVCIGAGLSVPLLPT